MLPPGGEKNPGIPFVISSGDLNPQKRETRNIPANLDSCWPVGCSMEPDCRRHLGAETRRHVGTKGGWRGQMAKEGPKVVWKKQQAPGGWSDPLVGRHGAILFHRLDNRKWLRRRRGGTGKDSENRLQTRYVDESTSTMARAPTPLIRRRQGFTLAGRRRNCLPSISPRAIAAAEEPNKNT